MRIGFSDWDYGLQRRIRAEIDRLDVTKAEAFDSKDKQMIDTLVVKSFGTFGTANKAIRQSVLDGYARAVVQASDRSHSNDRNLQCLKEGRTPLFDPRIIDLFS